MTRTTPTTQAILGYSEFFDQVTPENPLQLVAHFDRQSLIAELAGLNYRLRPKTELFYDVDVPGQLAQLSHFCGYNQQIFNAYSTRYKSLFTPDEKWPLLFTRQVCLFAIEEVLQSQLAAVPGFSFDEHKWKEIFSFILAMNSKMTERTLRPMDNDHSFEHLNQGLIPLNELTVPNFVVYTAIRGYKLMDFFSHHPLFNAHFKEYIRLTYGTNYASLVYGVLSMLHSNNATGEQDITLELVGKKLDMSFVYYVPSHFEQIFESLSMLLASSESERLVSVRKYPFVRISKSTCILTDGWLLSDKLYAQFINDFWFDYIKNVAAEGGKRKFDISYYRSEVGKFFEQQVQFTIQTAFSTAKYYVVKCFSQLRYLDRGQEKELTDIYIRRNRHVFIAEVKSSGLYDNEKYALELNTFYKGDRAAFFENFGLDQLVDSLIKLTSIAPSLDAHFCTDYNNEIFPAIVVNERSLQTPLMAQVFNLRFQELVVEKKVLHKRLRPLSILHISDLESIEDSIQKNPHQFWELLRHHLRQPKFIPPFFASVNGFKAIDRSVSRARATLKTIKTHAEQEKL
ncbi:MAG: hypothetical protein ABWZ25_08945 [Chitinophagaceae bacterium]